MKKFFYFLFSVVILSTVVMSCQENKNQTAETPQVAGDTVLVMHITYKVKPDRIEGFKKAFDQCAAETLKESGCEKYEIYQSYNDSTLFFLLEKWQNKAAHKNHMSTPHIKTYFETIDGAFEDGGSFELIQLPPAVVNQ